MNQLQEKVWNRFYFILNRSGFASVLGLEKQSIFVGTPFARIIGNIQWMRMI